MMIASDKGRGHRVHVSSALWMSLVSSLAVLACGREPLDLAPTGSGGGTGSAGTTGAGGTAMMVSPGGKPFDVCVGGTGCSSGLECYCGICTRPCMQGGCAALMRGGSCTGGIPWTSACEADSFESVCAINCSTDGDCAALGSTAVCTAGWCRRPLLVSTADGHVLSCADRAASMKARLDPVVANADRSCVTDADCVLAFLGNSCYGDGCDNAAVSATGAAAIKAELTTLNQECDAAFRAGCVGAGTVNCPSEAPATCVAGACQNFVPP